MIDTISLVGEDTLLPKSTHPTSGDATLKNRYFNKVNSILIYIM